MGHLRALQNPLKAVRHDQDKGGGGGVIVHSPPPVPVELLDALDECMTTLWAAWRVALGEEPRGRFSVSQHATVSDVYEQARGWADEILQRLPEIGRRDEIKVLGDAVLQAPDDSDRWSLASAFKRWSLHEEPYWAFERCAVASCNLRAVKVTPADMPGDTTTIRCESCGWEPPEDDDGMWLEIYSRRGAAA